MKRNARLLTVVVFLVCCLINERSEDSFINLFKYETKIGLRIALLDAFFDTGIIIFI